MIISTFHYLTSTFHFHPSPTMTAAARMMSTMTSSSWLVALVLLVVASYSSSGPSVVVSAATTVVSPSSAFSRSGGHFGVLTRSRRRHQFDITSPASIQKYPTLQIRGGANDDEDEYDSEVDDDDEEEPIIQKTKSLASSAKSVAQKKKSAALKSKVNVAISSSAAAATKKKGGKNIYQRYVPYILRACLNPFTLLAMTKAYFVSLCDINYLKEVSYSEEHREIWRKRRVRLFVCLVP
jgi:hypothetical protein